MAKKSNESKFDLEEELLNLQCPEMFKAGLRYYISSNDLKITDKKGLDKIVKEYGELSIGG